MRTDPLKEPCFDVEIAKPALGYVQRHHALDFEGMTLLLITPIGLMINRPEEYVRITVRHYGQTKIRLEANAPDMKGDPDA